MNLLNNSPSAETREKVADLQLGKILSCNYDILDNKLNRAIGIAGLITTASIEGDRTGLSFADITQTASALQDELRSALIVLEGWWKDNQQTPPPTRSQV